MEKARSLCQRAGFREITVRGDTDYSLTREFDAWSEGSRFVVGYDALPKVLEIAEELAEEDWRPFERREKKPAKTSERARPVNVREEAVVKREYKNFSLEKEEIAEFTYKPVACSMSYRMVVVRKTIKVSKGQTIIDGASQKHFFYNK